MITLKHHNTANPFMRISIVTLLSIFSCLLTGPVFAQQADSARSVLKDTTVLDEIIISAKTKIKINGDTVSYTVDSFYKDPMATTEDVLKRLPGVEVSRDGKISIEGKDVTKIFVNGKEYQAEDLRTITQNLPAEVLEKIQVADWYDEETQFSGIRKGSDQKSINLQFKKQYSSGVYGRAATGYGSKNRYQEGLFGSYMGTDLRLTTIGNMNNTGIADATNDAGADNARSGSIPGVQTKRQANLNFSYDGFKKLKLSGLYEISSQKTALEQSLLRSTYLPGDSLLLRRQVSAQTNKNLQHRLNLRSQYQISKMLSMTTSVNAGVRQGKNTNKADDITYYNEPVNPDFQRTSETDNNTSTPSVHFTNMLQKRFDKKGRSLALNIQANYTGGDNSTTTENLNQYYSPPVISTNNFETGEQKTALDTRVNIKYTEPLTEKSSVSFDYSNLYTTSNNDKQVWNEDSNMRVYDTVQSRQYENRNIENPFGLLYQYNTTKVTAGGGIDIKPYNRESQTVNQDNTSISQQGVNYFPSLFARYALSAKANLNINYGGSIIAPGINQLQPVPDYTDSLNIFIGNPNLHPELNNNMNLSYRYFNTGKQNVFWATLRGNWTNNKIVNKVDINASRRITIPVNTDGAYTIGGQLSYTHPLMAKKIKLTVSLNSNLARNVSFTNGVLQRVLNSSYQPSLKLVFSSIEWYEGDLNYSYRYNNVSSQVAGQTAGLLQSHTLSANGTFFLPRDFKLGYVLNYMVNNGLAAAYNKDFLLMHLRIDKTFKKAKGLSMRLQAFDIFNNYPNVQRTVGDNYYEDRSYNRIGNYMMVSFIYRFSWFPASAVDE